MDDIKAKQQVVEKIKEASKILVTVSDSPSVDALSAALGLTLLLDKQEKYATAIFSGEVPPAIAFLEPEKTFDETTDSLRDFIIALDKEKADHLRMPKPEPGDNMVRIYVTPYKSTISQDDLEFSQGDYNVELVIALGVASQEYLDQALENHGQILHDATVITVSAGDQTSDLGGIDWHDASASSLSEMIAGLAEALKEDKKKPLVDAPIATALLTGIVAETERFSNEHTTSKSMTVAAQLMSAGADQQLIATELRADTSAGEKTPEQPQEDTVIAPKADDQESISARKDELSIEHDEHDTLETTETLAELDERVRAKAQASESIELPVVEETPQVVEPQPVAEQPQPSVVTNVYAASESDVEPSFGGTLNATADQAAEDAHKEAMSDQNKTILSHAYLGQTGQADSSLGDTTPVGFPGTPTVAPGSVGINEVAEDLHSVYAPSESETTPAAGFGMSGEKVIAPLPSTPVPPTPPTPVDLGLPLPPPLPDFSQGPLAPPSPMPPVFPVTPDPAQQPEILGDILAPEAPASNSAYAPEPPTTPETPNDPGQFKIPS